MKPIPSHSTRSAVARVVRVPIILVIQLKPAVQFTLADGTVDPLLARFAPPIGIDPHMLSKRRFMLAEKAALSISQWISRAELDRSVAALTRCQH